MSKIIAVVGMMLLMNVAMFMFSFTGECEGADCSLSNYNTESGDTIWGFFTNPTDLAGSTLWQKLFGSTIGILATLTTAGGLIALGASIYYKDINIAYISLSIFLAGAVIGTWTRLWIMVNDSPLLGASSGGIAAMLLVGVGLATHLFFLIDWGRGR